MLGIFHAGIHLSATISDILPCKLIRHSFYCDKGKKFITSLSVCCECISQLPGERSGFINLSNGRST